MPESKSKKDLIDEFEMMKSTEESARDLYRQICEDSRVQQPRVKKVLSRIAEDEQRHIELVEKIVTIIKNTL